MADKRLVLKEAVRVLKVKGFLIIQVPNRFFPVDLHSGLPFVFLVPFRVRVSIFKRFGHEGLGRIDIPSIEQLKELVLGFSCVSIFYVCKVIYPITVIWSKLRFFIKLP